MGIYIPNMKMPKYTTKAEFGIDADGNPLCMVYHEDGTEPDIYDVVPLPEGHGRLVDEKWIKNAMITTLEALKKHPKMDKQEAHLIAAFDTLRVMLDDAPTIVDREE